MVAYTITYSSATNNIQRLHLHLFCQRYVRVSYSLTYAVVMSVFRLTKVHFIDPYRKTKLFSDNIVITTVRHILLVTGWDFAKPTMG